jgi:hypothetical protein
MPASQTSCDFPAKGSTYRSTSFRCTDFVPPHIGIVTVGGEDSAFDSFRRLREECAGASAMQGWRRVAGVMNGCQVKVDGRTSVGGQVR